MNASDEAEPSLEECEDRRLVLGEPVRGHRTCGGADEGMRGSSRHTNLQLGTLRRDSDIDDACGGTEGAPRSPPRAAWSAAAGRGGGRAVTASGTMSPSTARPGPGCAASARTRATRFRGASRAVTRRTATLIAGGGQVRPGTATGLPGTGGHERCSLHVRRKAARSVRLTYGVPPKNWNGTVPRSRSRYACVRLQPATRINSATVHQSSSAGGREALSDCSYATRSSGRTRRTDPNRTPQSLPALIAAWTVAALRPSRFATAATGRRPSGRRNSVRRKSAATRSADALPSVPLGGSGGKPSTATPESIPVESRGCEGLPSPPTAWTESVAGSGPRGRRFKSCLPDLRPRSHSGKPSGPRPLFSSAAFAPQLSRSEGGRALVFTARRPAKQRDSLPFHVRSTRVPWLKIKGTDRRPGNTGSTHSRTLG